MKNLNMEEMGLVELNQNQAKEVTGGILPWLLFGLVSLAVVAYYTIVGSPYADN